MFITGIGNGLGNNAGGYGRPAFSFQTTPSSINEGSSAAFIVTATNIANGSTLYWAITHQTTDDLDFSGVSGTAVFEGNSSTFYINAISDHKTEGTETFNVVLMSLPADGETYTTSNVVSVIDTSFDPTYTFTTIPTTVNEGSSATFIVSTTDVDDGAVLWWTTKNLTSTEVDFPGNNGTFEIYSHTGTFYVPVTADFFTEGSETFQVEVRPSSVITDAVLTSTSVTINDTSQTPTFNFSVTPTSIDEGAIGTFTVVTTNISNSTVLYWNVKHITSTSTDIVSVSGAFTITSSQGSFTVSPIRDKTTEGSETFQVEIKTSETSPVAVLTSTSVTINDTSQTPTYSITLTPGSINEGSAGSFQVTTTDVDDGTLLFWNAVNITTANADFSGTSGTFTVTGGTGTFSVSAIADTITEGPERFYVAVKATLFGVVVSTSTSVVVNDTSPGAGTGEIIFIGTGLQYWTVPAGVTSISVVGVGGGAGGDGGIDGYYSGGAGGALAYKNNISVIPGQVCELYVGAGGHGGSTNNGGVNGSCPGFPGQNTYFKNPAGTKVMEAGGGRADISYVISLADYQHLGGQVIAGDGGGAGGPAYYSWSSGGTGGGGAGGYTGAGGTGGKYQYSNTTAGLAGSAGSGGGGGGGGSGPYVSGIPGGSGGGVGLLGQGTTGTGGVAGQLNSSVQPWQYTMPGNGTGGSGGSIGTMPLSGVVTSTPAFLVSTVLHPYGGGQYGGGGGSGNYTSTSPTSYGALKGGDGAIRIVWPGNVRQFPSTGVGTTSSWFASIATSIIEGSTYSVDIGTTGYPDGELLIWTINHITTVAADFVAESGIIVINSGVGSFTYQTVADKTTEGDQTFSMYIRTSFSGGPIIATSQVVTLLDTSKSPTYAFGTVPTSINEGSNGTFNVVTTNVPDGTLVYWAINHITTDAIDFMTMAAELPGELSGTCTIANNAGAFTVKPVADGVTEGSETFTVSLYSDAYSTLKATTGAITVNDTSLNPATPGQAVFTVSGAWTVPAGVYSISAVCVGAGGGGSDGSQGTIGTTPYKFAGNGGSGGGLTWGNGILVTPGETLTMTVTYGQSAGLGVYGTQSWTQISRGSTVLIRAQSGTGSFNSRSSTYNGRGYGGYDPNTGLTLAPGGRISTGGGDGGMGGNPGAGGGAGGYSGSGGHGMEVYGGIPVSNGWGGTAGTGGSGGAAGGGSQGTPYATSNTSGSGGGVGILGEGASGAYGIGGNGGKGGSGGTDGTSARAGAYGGGGAGATPSGTTGYAGNNGAIRVMWGAQRAYPSTYTADNAGPDKQVIYTTAGTYYWTCPSGVTSVSVVCVGGGGGGGRDAGSVPIGNNFYGASGGGGGGLGWKNNIPVTPGQSYTVVVGARGLAGSGSYSSGTSGGDSYFIDTSTVKGGGGAGGYVAGGSGGGTSAGGTYVGQGGGNGGPGGLPNNPPIGYPVAGGGGGAGGYSGTGGSGGNTSGGLRNGQLGSGGGGGGGAPAYYSTAPLTNGNTQMTGVAYGGYGGGVGLNGQGANGAGGVYPGSAQNGPPGSPGSGGAAQSWGGGGGGTNIGQNGAVRIMWGTNRAYPSTNTADQFG